MRLDLFLDCVCLFKTRSAAAKAIRSGGIDVDGQPAKASHTVAPGEMVRIRYPGRIVEIEVLDVPTDRVDRKEARRFYRVSRDEPLDWA